MKKIMTMILYFASIPSFSISTYRCALTGHTIQCNDGTWTNSHGKGACSCHGGIKH
ncbi:hypothetical protein [Spiroplasma endosymbiont of Nebria brevicollis]|uniref:hypothetical protein n=1 Tax=Spiroplasma endosymbiont of Nebria brevicollis TaxID=3066284 RepID=UPI00313EDED5